MPNEVPGFDEDNPEWTEEDFRRARPASELPPEILAAFPNTRMPGTPPVSVPISDDIVRHFQAGGPGWEQRIDALLREAMKAGKTAA